MLIKSGRRKFVRETVLVVCRLPDPHVDAVRQYFEIDDKLIIWDLNNPGKTNLSVRLDELRSSPHPRSVWWRYKATTAEYHGASTPATAFASREWLAFLRSLAFILQKSLWINNPVLLSHRYHKVANLLEARRIGFKIPETLVTNSATELRQFQRRYRRVIYKPLTYYFEPPDVALFTSRVPIDASDTLESYLALAPCIFQKEIVKSYELRVTIVGSQVFAVRINSQDFPRTELDWRREQMNTSLYSIVDLNSKLRRKLLRLHRNLGLVYGAYDFIVDKKGELVFLEVNPSGQWLWLEQATGISISAAVASLLKSPRSLSRAHA